MTMPTKNHPDYIDFLLCTRNVAVERAILAIYERQTLDEKACSDTKHRNGIGFTGADARLGTYYAKWILSGKHLSGRHLENARQMSRKYIRQLVDIATSKLI
jgi:hypothetical protein